MTTATTGCLICGKEKAPASPRFCTKHLAAFLRSSQHFDFKWDTEHGPNKYTREQKLEAADRACLLFVEKLKERAQNKGTCPSLALKLRAGRFAGAICDMHKKAYRLYRESGGERSILDVHEALGREWALAGNLAKQILGDRQQRERLLKDTPPTTEPDSRYMKQFRARLAATTFADDERFAAEAEACFKRALNLASPLFVQHEPDWRPTEMISEDFYAL